MGKDGIMNGDPIDRTVFENLREVMGEDFGDLVETFLDGAPGSLTALKEAVASGDADALIRGAHSLKGASGDMGAVGLAALCKRLEAVGRAGSSDGAENAVREIEAEYERVKRALDGERHKEIGYSGV